MATAKQRTRKPRQIVVTFEQGSSNKLTVLAVYHDIRDFAEAVTDDPHNIPLFAKINL